MHVQTDKTFLTGLHSCCNVSFFPPTFLVTHSNTLPLNFLYLPEKVAAEDETEHEDEEADAQHNDIHIEREVIDVRRHAAVVFRTLRTQTTQASCQEEFADTEYRLSTHLPCRVKVKNVNVTKFDLNLISFYNFLYG